jgi:prevent-host-death family protein
MPIGVGWVPVCDGDERSNLRWRSQAAGNKVPDPGANGPASVWRHVRHSVKLSDMIAENAENIVTARDLSRQAAAVLDRVEHGERLTITRDGEPIAEIVPIDRFHRTMFQWIREGLIAPVPSTGYANAAAAAGAARKLPPIPEGTSATEVLLQMREDERQ